MNRYFVSAVSLSLAASAVYSTTTANKEHKRLEKCGVVLQEILNIPDDLPQQVLAKAECVIVFPSVLKLAFGMGKDYGRGAMVCRTGKEFNGPWGAPAMYALEGDSLGMQIGGESTDLILLVMNQKGAASILSSKIKLGGDASAAAGPKGRDASANTDLWMKAEILSYSRSRGLFAGISLAGSSVRPDRNANASVYGRKLEAESIVFKGAVAVPPAAQKFIATLNQKSPKNK